MPRTRNLLADREEAAGHGAFLCAWPRLELQIRCALILVHLLSIDEVAQLEVEALFLSFIDLLISCSIDLMMDVVLRAIIRLPPLVPRWSLLDQ